MENTKAKRTKKRYNKSCMMLLALTLCLLCSGCREKENDGEMILIENDDKKILKENDEIVRMKGMLDESVVEDEDLTPDAMVSNAILEKVEINLIEEYDTYMSVRISYPDAASLVIEMAKDTGQEYDDETINSVYEELAQRIEDGDVEMKEITLDISFEVDDKGERQIVWSAELMNALSGGLYELMMG